MSVATEFAPSVPIPARARPSVAGAQPERLASVSVLKAPADAAAAPLRLTRRGVVVLALAVALLGAALVWVAALSAPHQAPTPVVGPAVVTVEEGDTLWSIAGASAPGRDPRGEVAKLQRLNHLDGVALVPGQQLRVH